MRSVRRAGWIAAGLWLLCAAGCRMVRPAAEQAPQVAIEYELAVGQVVRVNEALRYVVIQCGSLPSTGEEAKVCRGDEVIGRVVLSGPFRAPFVVADIADGEPAQGDTIRVIRKKTVPAPDERGEP